MTPRDAQLIALWNRGLTLDLIASALSLNVNTVGAQIRRLRIRLGDSIIPRRNEGIGYTPTYNRVPSPFDDIVVGNMVVVSKATGGTRQNVHQAARVRGWKISITDNGTDWMVTALERVDTLRVGRRAKARAARAEAKPL